MNAEPGHERGKERVARSWCHSYQAGRSSSRPVGRPRFPQHPADRLHIFNAPAPVSLRAKPDSARRLCHLASGTDQPRASNAVRDSLRPSPT